MWNETTKRAIAILAALFALALIIFPASAGDEPTTTGTLTQISWTFVSIQADAVTTVEDQLTIKVAWAAGQRTETITALSVSGGNDQEANYTFKLSDWRELIGKLLEPVGESITLAGTDVVTLTEGLNLTWVDCNGVTQTWQAHYVPFLPSSSDKKDYPNSSNVWVLKDKNSALWAALAPGESSPLFFNTSDGGRHATVHLPTC